MSKDNPVWFADIYNGEDFKREGFLTSVKIPIPPFVGLMLDLSGREYEVIEVQLKQRTVSPLRSACHCMTINLRVKRIDLEN